MFRPDIGYRCSDIVRVSDDSRRALVGVVLFQDTGYLCSGIVRLSFDDRRSTLYWTSSVGRTRKMEE
jgi:hypothetical protein